MKFNKNLLLNFILFLSFAPAIAQITKQPKNITLCNNGNGFFEVKAATASTYIWQDSSSTGWNNLSNNSTFSGVNADTLKLTKVLASLNNRLFRVIVDSAGLGVRKDTSISVVLTVLNSISKAAISQSQIVCYNTSPDTLRITQIATGGNGTFTYQWQSSSNGNTWSNISGQSANKYFPGKLIASTYYRIFATSGFGCGSVASDSVFIEVLPQFKAGNISQSHSICYNTQPDTIRILQKPTGGNGTYTYQWIRSTDQRSWSVISGQTGIKYLPGKLLSDEYFRLVVTSGQGCGSDSTNSVKISVWPQIQKAIIKGNQAICYNSKPDTIKMIQPAKGGDNNFSYQWQFSLDGVAWNNISGQMANFYLPGALTTSTFYRVVSTSTFGCGIIASDSVFVEVYPILNSGTILKSQNICFNTRPDSLKFSTLPSGGGKFYYYQWQESADSVIFTNITGASNIFYVPNVLQQTKYFRVIVASQFGCSTDTTNIVKVNVFAPFQQGTLSGGDTICYNSRPDTIKILQKPTGGNGIYTYQWLRSSDQKNWIVISGQNSLNYHPSQLQADEYYRLVVSSGQGCGSDSTNIIHIKVWPQIQKAIIRGNQSICYNSQPDTIKIIQPAFGADNNFTYQWQSSANGTSWINITGQTSISYLPNTLTNSIYYRVIATSIFGCGIIASDSVFVEVYPNLQSGTITNNQNICFNTAPSQLNFNVAPSGGGNSYNYQWQISNNSSNFTNINLATATSYQPDTLISSRFYRVVITSKLGCGTVTSNIIKINVYSPFVKANIGSDEVICFNTPAETLRVTSLPKGGNNVYSYQWLKSIDSANWIPIPGQTQPNHFTGNLTTTTFYRLISSSGNDCGRDTSNAIKIKVNPLPDTSLVLGLNTVCRNQQDLVYQLSKDSSLYYYSWSISSGTILSGKNKAKAYISWNDIEGVDTIKVKQTNKLTGCSNTMKLPIRIINSRAPGKTSIIRKPNSNILIAEDNTPGINYQWGYIIKSTGISYDIPGANLRYVQLPHTYDTTIYIYFIKTGMDGCITTSYFNYDPIPISVEEIIPPKGIKIYPNPSNGKLYLEGFNFSKVKIRIMDIQGRNIDFELNKADSTINLNHSIPDGVYFMMLISNSTTETKKIIIAK